MLFAYDRLGLLIEGVPGQFAPATPSQLRDALIKYTPTAKELAFLRRLCRSLDAGALLAVVCMYDCSVFDTDDAHNAMVARNCETLARIVKRMNMD